MGTPKLINPVLDAVDVRELAEFYRRLLDLRYREGHPQEDWATLLYQDGTRFASIQGAERLEPTTWPDPAVPQQMHLDFAVNDTEELDRQHERVLELGGALRFDRGDDPEEQLRVYTDPAGHTFCLIVVPGPED